jgi:oligopeptidase A
MGLPLTLQRCDVVGLDRHHQTLTELLRSHLASPRLTADQYFEVSVIYNTAAHAVMWEFLSNGAVSQSTQSFSDAVRNSRAVDERLASLLMSVAADSGDMSAAIEEHALQLAHAGADTRAVIAAQEAVDRASRELAVARRDLLRRLKLVDDRLDVNATAYAQMLVAALPRSTKEKFLRAWRRTATPTGVGLVEALDRLNATEWADARSKGYASVYARNTRRSSMSAPEIERVLDAAVGSALVRSGAADRNPLERDLDEVRIELGRCLGAIASALELYLGLDVRPVADADGISVWGVGSGGRLEGRIYIDPWDAERKRGGANHTRCMRNRAHRGAFEQLPIAYVSLRLASRDGCLSVRQIGTVLHEIGHAVDHLMQPGDLPFGSSLEYAPPERAEILPAVMEALLGEATFVVLLAESEREQGALRRGYMAIRARADRTSLAQGVAAWVDYDVSRRARSYGDALASLRSRHQGLVEVSLDDVVDAAYVAPRSTPTGTFFRYVLAEGVAAGLGTGSLRARTAASTLEAYRRLFLERQSVGDAGVAAMAVRGLEDLAVRTLELGELNGREDND